MTKTQRRVLDRLAGFATWAATDTPGTAWQAESSLAGALPNKPRSRSLVMNTLERARLVARRWDAVAMQYDFRITDTGLEALGQKALKLDAARSPLSETPK